jgi:hypothetical protein
METIVIGDQTVHSARQGGQATFTRGGGSPRTKPREPASSLLAHWAFSGTDLWSGPPAWMAPIAARSRLTMRIFTAIWLATALLTAGTFWAQAAAQPIAATELLFIEAEQFASLGGWVIDQQFMDQMGSPYLLAHGLESFQASGHHPSRGDRLHSSLMPVGGLSERRSIRSSPGTWRAGLPSTTSAAGRSGIMLKKSSVGF